MNKNPHPLSSPHYAGSITKGQAGNFPSTQDLSHRTIECRGRFGNNILLRHGIYEKKNQISPEEKDGPLMEEGVAQMKASAVLLANYLPTFVSIVVAPRQRNRESGDIIKAELAKHNVFVVSIEESDELTQDKWAKFGKENIWELLPPSPHLRLLITAQPCIQAYAAKLKTNFVPDFGEAITEKGDIISRELPMP